MIKITSSKGFSKEISKGVLKLIIAGFVIGYLKAYDWVIAVLLLLKIIHVMYVNLIKPTSKNWILLTGMILTGVAGTIAEFWGIGNGYWEYHEVTRILPLWVPLAWALAFYFLYRIESGLISYLKNKTIQNKLIIAFWLSLIIPAFGEVITINLGVWTYYWPYQIFGVPLYAFACLVFVHMLVYAILSYVCKRYKINDVVFT